MARVLRCSVDFDGIKVAHLHADAAADADIRIDDMGLAAFAGDGIDRAVAGADGAAGAELFQNFVADQGPANFGRAAFFVDMGFIFLAEVLERADDRVGSALTQTAQAGGS